MRKTCLYWNFLIPIFRKGRYLLQKVTAAVTLINCV